jgi:hypothetical protein
MQLGSSLLCSQEHNICFCTEWIQFKSSILLSYPVQYYFPIHSQVLQVVSLSCFPTNIFSVFILSLMCVSCPAHLILLDFMVIIFVELCILRSSSLCSFLKHPVVSLLGQNILISTVFSNAHNLCSFLLFLAPNPWVTLTFFVNPNLICQFPEEGTHRTHWMWDCVDPSVGLDVMASGQSLSLPQIESPIFQPVANLTEVYRHRTHGVVTFTPRRRKTGVTLSVYSVWLPSVLRWVEHLNSRILKGQREKLHVEGSLFCGSYELASRLVGQFRSSYTMEGCVPSLYRFTRSGK